MATCSQCEPWPDSDERERDWCETCGFYFDRFGMRLLEPWRTCPVHHELRASCPHTGPPDQAPQSDEDGWVW